MITPLYKLGDLIFVITRHNEEIQRCAVITNISLKAKTDYAPAHVYYDYYDLMTDEVGWFTQENILFFSKKSLKSDSYIEVVQG